MDEPREVRRPQPELTERDPGETRQREQDPGDEHQPGERRGEAEQATAGGMRRTAAHQPHPRPHHAGTECGEVADGTDTDVAATWILSVAHGLADVVALTGDPTRATIDAVLDPVVATVFTGRCRRYERG
ncbi:MAG TPA: hypothetical protein VGE77_04905 [Nocardioides sp.]